MRSGKDRAGLSAIRPLLASTVAAALGALLFAACGTATTPRGTLPGTHGLYFAYNASEHHHGCSASYQTTYNRRIEYRPPGLSRAHKVPLLIALHGSGGGPINMEGLSHFESVAQQHGFVVAYLASCNEDHPWGPTQDLPYMSAEIKTIMANENIDPTRVYAAGFSAGGLAAWKLACGLSTRVAAVAIVANNMASRLFDTCAPARPISHFLLVGTADRTRYRGVPGVLPSAQQTTTRWLGIDHCALKPVSISVVGVATGRTWRACADGTAVSYWTVAGASHSWPPYGPGAPKYFKTSEVIWAFLAAHRAAPLTLRGDARIVSLRTTGTASKRTIIIRLGLRLPVTAVEQVGSGGHVARRSVRLNAGPSVTLAVKVRGGVRAGKYPLSLSLVDSYHRKLTVHRTVHLPA